MKLNYKAILGEYIVPSLTELGYEYKFFKDQVGEGYWFTCTAPIPRENITIDILYRWANSPCIRFRVASFPLYEYFGLVCTERLIDKYFFTTKEELIDWIGLLLPHLIRFERLFFEYGGWTTADEIKKKRMEREKMGRAAFSIDEWTAIRAGDIRDSLLMIDKKLETINISKNILASK